MDQQQIEMLATNAVKTSILRSDYLSPLISDNDKEPSWDGHIYLYREPGRKKDGIRRIPVQVKGTTGKYKEKDSRIKYSVKVADLRNYHADGGVLYFVVLVSPNGTVHSIYYSDLLPLRIRHELDFIDEQQKKVALEFKKFPDDIGTIKAIMESFYKHKEMQASIATVDLAELPSIEKLQEADVLRGITMTTASVHDTRDPIKALLHDESYVYAKVKGTELPIPVDMIGSGSEQMVQYQVDKTVSVNGIVYYENYQIIRSANETKVMIGKSFTMVRPEAKGSGLTITFKLCESLRQRCIDLLFWLSVIDAQSLEIDGASLPEKLSFSDMDSVIQKGEQELAYYQDLVCVLDVLGISQDANCLEMTDYDRREFNLLINALVKKQPVGPMRDDLELNYAINLCGLTIALVHYESPESDGLSTVTSFFDDSISVCFSIDGADCFAPPYATLNKEHWSKIANIRFDQVAPAFKRMYDKGHDSTLFEVANNSLLSLLSAYDEAGRDEMLSAAIALAEWLLNSDSENTLATNIALMNYYQAIRRERELTKEEQIKLHGIIEEPSIEEKFKLGAYLLLGNQVAAEIHFARLSSDEQERFVEWPIYRFWGGNKS